MSLLYYTLDERGEPAPCEDILAWARWYESADRKVAFDRVGEARVSTVFLAIDHGIPWPMGKHSPILDETMVFGGEHDLWQDRYCSAAEARAGHARVVARLREGLPPEHEGWEHDG